MKTDAFAVCQYMLYNKNEYTENRNGQYSVRNVQYIGWCVV